MFLPSGTLANQLAVRRLAKGRSRVIVQAESHLSNDSGDCVERLSGLNLVPLAPGRATFTREEVEARARENGVRPRRDGGRRHLDRVPRAAAPRRDVRSRPDAGDLGPGAGAGDRSPSRRRAPHRRLGVHGHRRPRSTRPSSTRSTSRSGSRSRRAAARSSRGPAPSSTTSTRTAGCSAGRCTPPGPSRPSRDITPTACSSDCAPGSSFPRPSSPRSPDSDVFAFERVKDGTSRIRLTVRGAPADYRARLEARGIVLPHPESDASYWLTVNETWARMSGAALAATMEAALRA